MEGISQGNRKPVPYGSPARLQPQHQERLQKLLEQPGQPWLSISVTHRGQAMPLGEKREKMSDGTWRHCKKATLR